MTSCAYLSIESVSGQLSLRLVALEWGNVLNNDKHFWVQPSVTFVGCFVKAWDFFSMGRRSLCPTQAAPTKSSPSLVGIFFVSEPVK